MRKMIKLIKLLHILLFLAVLSCIPKPGVVYTTKNADSGEALLSRAENLFHSKNSEKAIAVYKEYLAGFPDNKLIPAVLMRMGNIYENTRQNENARKVYMHIINNYTESSYTPDAIVRLMESFINEGMYGEAINFSNRLPRVRIPDSYFSKIYILAGDAQMSLKLQADAVLSYSMAQSKSSDSDREKIDKKLLDAIAQLETGSLALLAQNAKDKALKGYLEYQLGLNYYKNNKYREATDVLSNFIKTIPSHRNIEAAKILLNDIYKKTAGGPHTIGCLLPLSGKFSVFGNRALKGIELALIRFSLQSGYSPVNLSIKDTESDPEKAEIAADELIKQNVSAIIGPMGSEETVSAAKKAQAGHVPIIVLSQKENITDTGDFVFRNFLTPGMQVKSLVQYAINKKGMNRFVVLYPNESYGRTFSALFISEVQANGGKILKSESYDPTLTDFTDSIKKLFMIYGSPATEAKNTRTDFDAIFIPDAPAKAGLIVPQLAYLDLRNIYLLGTNLWHSQKMIEMAEEFLEDWVIITDGFFFDNDSEEVINFVREFEEKYKEKPGYIEAVSYDTALMLFQTVGTPNVGFADSVKKELNNIRNFKALTGLTSFGGSRDARKKLHILTISGGGFVEIGRE